MIISRLTGGLGNQMFQYAAGLALAERHRTVLKLDVSWFGGDPAFEAHNRYALDCLNVTAQFATPEEIDRVRGVRLTRTERWSVALARALRFQRYAAQLTSPGHICYDETFAFRPDFFDQPDGTYLHGNWQSEKFFTPIVNLLRLHFSFRYPPPPAVEAMAARIRTGGTSAFVHFRRGDYVRNATFNREIGVLPLAYYTRAMALLRARVPEAKLFVFSDDIDTVEREFQPGGSVVYVRATEPWHSFDKIRLMSLCDHGIISNSTFAWWAAWLSRSPEKLIVAPEPWFDAGGRSGADIVPAAWTKLPRSA